MNAELIKSIENSVELAKQVKDQAFEIFQTELAISKATGVEAYFTAEIMKLRVAYTKAKAQFEALQAVYAEVVGA